MRRVMRLAAIVLSILLTGFVENNSAFAQVDAVPTWFKLDTSLAGDWEVVAVPGSPFEVRLRRRNVPEADVKRHILSLQSRSSSAYDVALSEVARVVEEKGLAAEILVVDYNSDKDRAQTAVRTAEQDGFDMILATGSEATAWLWKTYRGGRLPVVSVCAKDPVALGQVKSYVAGTGTNFALTSLNLPADVQMAYLLELVPTLRNLAIIVDSSNVSAVETQAIPIAEQARARGIRVINVAVNAKTVTGASKSKGVAEQLAGLVGNAVEAMRLNDVNLGNSLFLVTGSTAVFQEMDSINAHASRVPVVSMVPEIVQSGAATAVLSIGVSFRSNAFLAALYVSNILSGKQHVGDLKVGVVTPPDIAINFRRAREIGLKVPFSFFESANVIYDNEDRAVRINDLSAK